MTVPVLHHPATYDDLLTVPESMVAELIDGELHTSPRPRGPHGTTATQLAGWLVPRFRFGEGGPGGWWIVGEPEVHFGARADTQVTVPDLAGWRRERMPEVPRDHRYRVVPDWICEIASPSTARLDRAVKMPLYAQHGVRYVWIIDPEERVLEVFRLEAGDWLLVGTYSQEQRVNAEPFEEIELDLRYLWA
jgi:Uma2 family endonuclease